MASADAATWAFAVVLVTERAGPAVAGTVGPGGTEVGGAVEPGA